jgi:hypothetical protein
MNAELTVTRKFVAFVLLTWTLAVVLVTTIVVQETSGPATKTPAEIHQCEMEKVLAGRSLYESEMLCK